MSRQFVSTLSITLQLIQALPFWVGDNPSRDLKLCRAAPLFCLPTRSISQRIFEHVLPCRGTTRHPGYLSVAPAEICDSNIFVYSSMIISFGLHSRWVHPMWSISSTCPAILMSSTDTEKNNPCFRRTTRHSQFGVHFPIQVPIELPRIVFLAAILPMGVDINFVQKVPLGLEC